MSRADPLKPRGAPRGKPFPRGTDHPNFGKPRVPESGRPKGTGNKVPIPIKEFILGIMEGEKYRANVQARLEEGRGGPLELLALQWHGGRPGMTMEIKGDSLDKLHAIAVTKGLVSKDEGGGLE